MNAAGEAGLKKLGESLSTAFSTRVVPKSISLFGEDANGLTHWTCVADDGRVFGLKIMRRLEVRDGLSAEVAAHNIAEQVACVNAVRARRLDPIPGLPDELGSEPFAAIEWLMGEVRPLVRDVKDAKMNPIQFLTQYGEWAVITTLVSAKDRHEKNLLWDRRERRLAHIDFERALEEELPFDDPDAPELKEQAMWARIVGGMDWAAWRASPDARCMAFESGIRSGHAKLVNHVDVVKRIVRAGPFRETAVNSSLRWLAMNVDEKIATFRALSF